MRSASCLCACMTCTEKYFGGLLDFCHFALKKERIPTDELQTPVHVFDRDVLWHGCHLEPVSRTATQRVCLVLEGAGHQHRLFIVPECMFCLFAAAVVVAVHRSRLTL